MKKLILARMMFSAVLAVPFLLTGCEEFDEFFGGSSRSPGYDSSYSAKGTKVKTQHNASSQENDVVSESKSSSKGATTQQSGTAATTVSAPVSTEKKTATGTVDAPAVPSMAPTVGQ